MPKSRKRKPSFDLPRTSDSERDTTWVYRTTPPAADAPKVTTAELVESPPPPAVRIQARPNGRQTEEASLVSAASLVKGTVFFAELSLSVTEALPEFGYAALRRVAGFIPGSDTFVGIFAIPVRANAAACSAGRRVLRAISGETPAASR